MERELFTAGPNRPFTEEEWQEIAREAAEKWQSRNPVDWIDAAKKEARAYAPWDDHDARVKHMELTLRLIARLERLTKQYREDALAMPILEDRVRTMRSLMLGVPMIDRCPGDDKECPACGWSLTEDWCAVCNLVWDNLDEE